MPCGQSQVLCMFNILLYFVALCFRQVLTILMRASEWMNEWMNEAVCVTLGLDNLIFQK